MHTVRHGVDCRRVMIRRRRPSLVTPWVRTVSVVLLEVVSVLLVVLVLTALL